MTSTPTGNLTSGPIRRWIIAHDDSWWFIIPYVGLAVILSIVLSLFWLVAVVGAHFVLEWMRQSYTAQTLDLRRGLGDILLRVLWELKLDIGLVLFALALTLYMEMTLGVLGIGSAARATTMAGVRAGARFSVMQQVLRGVLLSLDDMAQIIRALLNRRNATSDADSIDGAAPVTADDPAPLENPWLDRAQWGRGDYLTLGFGAGCLALVAAAPLLTGQDVSSVLVTIASEMHPFPPGDGD